MKKLNIAILLGLATLLSANLPAAQNNTESQYRNQEQREDQVNGYGKTEATKGEAPVSTIGQNNQDQVEDETYGYSKTKASKGEAPESTLGHNNQEQVEDTTYGYQKQKK